MTSQPLEADARQQAQQQLLADVTADNAPDFENVEVALALTKLQQNAGYAELAALLNALREGYLVVDVTGTTSKKKGTRARTIRSTTGKMVLPIFTSMQQLRAAVSQGAKGRKVEPQGAIMPAQEALALIRSGPIVAIELDPAGAKQVLLRKFVELVLGADQISAQSLEIALG